MIANIGPADYNFDESLTTLRYANRAKSIKIQKKETAKIYSRLKVLKVHLIILREVIEMYFIIDFNSINLFYNVNPKI